jgi:D-alanyl-lipoteichoic acid acyltransferase DltB (MBOAT superfamily)
LRRTVLAKVWLGASSLFFYSYWDIRFLPILLASILFNFTVGNVLVRMPAEKQSARKLVLFFGIAADVALLGYFKYADFFIENVNALFGTSFALLNLALPLGISFFTFTQIAYLVDSYRLNVRENSFNNYVLFVTFFPHLIAGPVLHHREMMPQFANIRNKVLNSKNIALGIFVFTIGLVKKVLIADTFAPFASHGFDQAASLGFIDAWITSLSYTLQLYFDFSGYTDMAIGAALMFNIRLPINFNSPYKALDIQDFWRRWHMTLSRFLLEYIYIPLGGNRKGKWRTYFNLMAVFIIGGIWHGAGWTYVFWGFLHGAAMVVHRFWKQLGLRMHKLLAWFITFNFVNVAWVFFRARDWEDAVKVLKGMFGFNGIELPGITAHLPGIAAVGEKLGIAFVDIPAFAVLFIAVFLGVALFTRNSNELSAQFKPSLKMAAAVSVLFVYSLLNLNKISEFLYFQF